MIANLVFCFSLLFEGVLGHYVFNRLSIDGVESEPFRHVRRNSNGIHPIIGFGDPALRCNKDGHVSGNTETIDVIAGSTITWLVEPYVYHPGPLSFFMTKVPDASKASGAGEWFKIHDIGPKLTKRGGDWKETQQQSFNVTVPPCLAPGEYLMRIQQVGVHVPGAEPQFHVSCAQLRVHGQGTEMPSQDYMVRIPEVFKRNDPGFTQNIFMNFKEYTVPGGDVWKC